MRFRIDLNDLENIIAETKRDENIEIKDARKGLPGSLWESISAFANTHGGTIILGVVGNRDHTFEIVGLPDPQKTIKGFWDEMNRPQRINRNILNDEDVAIATASDKKLIVINVNEANKEDKPIFINGNATTGTFKRKASGDYVCSESEIKALVFEGDPEKKDRRVIESLDMDAINMDTLHDYRITFKNLSPDHSWTRMNDSEFMHQIRIVGRGKDGLLHPTYAGLLMFGKGNDILDYFPGFQLDYKEIRNGDERWSDRLESSMDDRCENIYDFFSRAYDRIKKTLRNPFKMDGIFRVDDTDVHKAVREAMVNCFSNADYTLDGGVVIVKRDYEISFANPGLFRIPQEDALIGGTSSPRNPTILKYFGFIKLGERTGSGIPMIYRTCKGEGWDKPVIEERKEPWRTIVTIRMYKTPETDNNINEYNKTNGANESNEYSESNEANGANEPQNGGNAYSEITITDVKADADSNEKKISAKQRSAIVDFISNNGECAASDIKALLGVNSSRARKVLSDMVQDGILSCIGSNKNRRYVISNNNDNNNDGDVLSAELQ